MTRVSRFSRPADRFTMVSNEFARDFGLRDDSRSVALWIFSHSEGFVVTPASVRAATGKGRDAVARIFSDLEARGYLRKIKGRTDEGTFLTTDYELDCRKFIDETPGQVQSLETQELDAQSLVNQSLDSPTHKKTIPKKTRVKKINPPGGQPAAVAPWPTPELAEEERSGVTLETTPPAPALEEPMEQAALFAVEEPPPPPPAEDARAIVAAFVDAYRASHAGRDPLGQDIGKVGSAAKRMLGKDKVPFAVLRAVAVAMASTPFTDLAGQYRRHTSTAAAPSGRMGMHRVAPGNSDDEEWAQIAAGQAERNEQVRQQMKLLKAMNSGNVE